MNITVWPHKSALSDGLSTPAQKYSQNLSDSQHNKINIASSCDLKATTLLCVCVCVCAPAYCRFSFIVQWGRIIFCFFHFVFCFSLWSTYNTYNKVFALKQFFMTTFSVSLNMGFLYSIAFMLSIQLSEMYHSNGSDQTEMIRDLVLK